MNRPRDTGRAGLRIGLVPTWALLALLVVTGCSTEPPAPREVPLTGAADEPATPDAVARPPRAIATH